jgi:hypothetical protein
MKVIGSGLYLEPEVAAIFRSKRGVSFDSFLETFDKIEPLSNFDIVAKCQKLNINNFKGVFMRDELNKNRAVSDNECLILNIDHSANSGTHWTSLLLENRVSTRVGSGIL